MASKEKLWQDLKPAEKIEDLRADVLKIFGALKRLSDEIERLQHQASEAEAARSKTGPKNPKGG